MVKDGSGDQQGKEEIQMNVKSAAEDAQQDGTQEAPGGEPAKGPPGAASSGKSFGIVTYILLGLFVLLTVMFVVELLKFRQMSGEIKDLKDDVTKQLARMKQELITVIQTKHNQLVEGHRNIENRISRWTDQMRGWHSELRAQLADMKDKCQPRFECPEQWKLFDQKCYYLSQKLEDWSSSQRFCSSKMANLAVIDSYDKQAFVKKAIKSTKHWIGLNESSVNGVWLWVDGTSSSQTFWSSNEPKDIGSYEACAGTNRDGDWVVYSCSERMNFICERPVFCHFK